MAYPICGDPSRMQTYYYCSYNYMCSITEGADARYRKTVDDSGDVCAMFAKMLR